MIKLTSSPLGGETQFLDKFVNHKQQSQESHKMPKIWNPSKPVDSFPLAYHKALSEVGVHLLAESLSPGEAKRDAQKFSMFRACCKQQTQHKLHAFIDHHNTRTRYDKRTGILWCHTTLNPLLGVLVNGEPI